MSGSSLWQQRLSTSQGTGSSMLHRPTAITPEPHMLTVFPKSQRQSFDSAVMHQPRGVAFRQGSLQP